MLYVPGQTAGNENASFIACVPLIFEGEVYSRFSDWYLEVLHIATQLQSYVDIWLVYASLPEGHLYHRLGVTRQGS